ncbi:MAG TPA: septum formation initiator family protein [candidate division WWE3 bacterium]|uniref:Septum formation initiator family protein n=1 Tax=candidate division WWE3 bacterium TaxID=2053526 RepID=A0A7C1HV48_UNCKA|nr:septum formation initiator family protein [candidate division WWE3 bacterium]
MQVPAHVKYLFLAFLLVGASVNMLATTRQIIKSSKRLEESKKEVLSLKDERNNLEAQIDYKKTQSFIEKFARDKLNMVLPGEEVYIYPEESVHSIEATEVGGREKSVLGEITKEKKKGVKENHFQEWLDLLF